MAVAGTTTGRSASTGGSRFARLTSFELMYLHVENTDWPCHFGGLAILEGSALLDSSGRLQLQEIRDRLDRRVRHVPALRRRLHVPGRLGGRPLWVDDQHFAIEHHVHEMAVESPGGDAELLATAARLYGRLLNRNRPLWELWFLTGLDQNRVAALLKLQHAVADGMSAVAIMCSLFDREPDAPDPAPSQWTPEPVPSDWSLLADNLFTKAVFVRRAARACLHPAGLIPGARVATMVTRRTMGEDGAPRTSLNEPVRAGRSIRILRLERTAMKRVARAHGGTINDVVLCLWAGALRQLLVSRGEWRPGLEVAIGQAVSLRSRTRAGAIDNQVGTVVVRLPAWEAEVDRRLDLVVEVTRRTKGKRQRPAAIMGVLVGLAATPIGRYVFLHQRASSALVTNVPGPSAPVYVLGARIIDILPIIPIMGNIGLTLCAFSYAGKISLVVTAAASSFPDVDVLMAGMEREWRALVRSDVHQPVLA